MQRPLPAVFLAEPDDGEEDRPRPPLRASLSLITVKRRNIELKEHLGFIWMFYSQESPVLGRESCHLAVGQCHAAASVPPEASSCSCLFASNYII